MTETCIICLKSPADFKAKCGHSYHLNCLRSKYGPHTICCPECKKGTDMKLEKFKGTKEEVDGLSIEELKIFAVSAASDANIPHEHIFNRFEKDVGINVEISETVPLLHVATSKNNLAAVKYLLKLGADLEFKSKIKKTCLLFVVEKGNKEMVKFLLDSGADVNSVDAVGMNSLFYASYNGDYEMVKILIDAGIDLKHLDDNGDSALRYSINGKNFEIMKLLIEKGSDIYLINYENQSMWSFVFSEGGNLEMLQYLVEVVGLDLEKRENSANEATPLHLASIGNKPEVVEYLLNKGAEVNSKSCKSEEVTPLFYAAHSGNLNIVKLLIGAGATQHFNHLKTKQSPFDIAIQQKHLDVAKYLLEKGAEANNVTEEGYYPLTYLILFNKETPESLELFKDLLERYVKAGLDLDNIKAVQKAVLNGNIEMLKLLKEKGANLNVKNDDGDSILFYSSDYYTFKFLIDEGLSLDVTSKSGLTPLMQACKIRDIRALNFILEKGVDIKSLKSSGQTGIHEAAFMGNAEVFEKLVKMGFDVNQPDKSGFYPVHHVANGFIARFNTIITVQDSKFHSVDRKEYMKILKILELNGANFDIPNKVDGRTFCDILKNTLASSLLEGHPSFKKTPIEIKDKPKDQLINAKFNEKDSCSSSCTIQ